MRDQVTSSPAEPVFQVQSHLNMPNAYQLDYYQDQGRGRGRGQGVNDEDDDATSNYATSPTRGVDREDMLRMESTRMALEKALWLASRTVNTPSNVIF